MSIVLDGTTGITTPGLTNTGTETLVNLTTTGNTILGDASTDTLNVGNGGLIKDASGNVGIGTASPDNILHLSSASPRLTFTATNNTSGARYNTLGTATTGSHRFQYGGTEILTVGITGYTTALQGASSVAGVGITFPAAQSASSDANTLDDYEEGTFTPTIGGAATAGTGTYATDGQVGRYTKIGNRCTFVIWLQWTNLTGSSGVLQVYGLPFTQKAVTNVYTPLTAYMDTALTLSANNVFQAYIIGSSTNIFLSQYVTGGGNAAGVPLDTAAAIMISGTYETS